MHINRSALDFQIYLHYRVGTAAIRPHKELEIGCVFTTAPALALSSRDELAKINKSKFLIAYVSIKYNPTAV